MNCLFLKPMTCFSPAYFLTLFYTIVNRHPCQQHQPCYLPSFPCLICFLWPIFVLFPEQWRKWKVGGQVEDLDLGVCKQRHLSSRICVTSLRDTHSLRDTQHQPHPCIVAKNNLPLSRVYTRSWKHLPSFKSLRTLSPNKCTLYMMCVCVIREPV